jgi:hypothetical protein
MTIHIVKNEHGDEVAAYTDHQHARLTAEEFEYFFLGNLPSKRWSARFRSIEKTAD